jgi:hypothetical protein
MSITITNRNGGTMPHLLAPDELELIISRALDNLFHDDELRLLSRVVVECQLRVLLIEYNSRLERLTSE